MSTPGDDLRQVQARHAASRRAQREALAAARAKVERTSTEDTQSTGHTPLSSPPTHALGSDDHWGVPPAEVQLRLSVGFGAILRAERITRGLSGRALGRRATVGNGTVSRLERGLRRPRPVTVQALALGLDADDPMPIRDRLLEAAGGDLAPDTPAGVRRRRRVERQAWREGSFPLPSRTARLIAVGIAVDGMSAAWFSVMDAVIKDPDNPHLLDRALSLGEHLHEAEQELTALGGPIMTSFGEPSGRTRLVGAGIAHLR